MVNLEIIYSASDKSIVHIKCSLPQGSTVLDALNKCGILVNHPEIQAYQLGIFSKRVTTDTEVNDGDRIEIYRPLVSDPKEKRRQRVHLKKKQA